jgi:phosphotransferase system HPr (HPr) family protein
MQREVTILNKLGLHARPASEFVRCAQTFRSEIRLRKNNETFSGANILDVLSANLDCGATMTIEADGPDAETALNQLSELLHEFKKQEELEGI